MPISEELLEAYGQKKLDNFTHWVYVLSCSNRCRTFNELERRAESRLSRKPPWLREAFESSRLIYIGQTENLQKRLGQHFKEVKSSEFTTLFPPSEILRLDPQHSRNSAEYHEHRLTESYNKDRDIFAYSR